MQGFIDSQIDIYYGPSTQNRINKNLSIMALHPMFDIINSNSLYAILIIKTLSIIF